MSQQAIWMLGGSLFTALGVIAGAIVRELMADGRQARELAQLEAYERAARDALDAHPMLTRDASPSPSD